jgi:hypothetical protein
MLYTQIAFRATNSAPAEAVPVVLVAIAVMTVVAANQSIIASEMHEPSTKYLYYYCTF